MNASIASPSHLAALSGALPDFLRKQRWFAGKAQKIQAVEVVDLIPIRNGTAAASLFLVRVEYAEASAQTYAIPLEQAFITPDLRLRQGDLPSSDLRVPVRDGAYEGTVPLFDAIRDEGFLEALLEAIANGRVFTGMAGELVGTPTVAFDRLRGEGDERLPPSILKAEQSNTSIVYGGRLILKLFRRIARGVNPEIEICSFLTEETSFANFPAVAGTLEYRQPQRQPMSLAVLQAFVPNQGDAWKYTLSALGDYFDRTATYKGQKVVLAPKPLLALSQENVPAPVAELIGTYLDSVRLLGVRTAELHVALASGVQHPAFVPEPFSAAYQQSVYESMVALARRNLELLRRRSQLLPGDSQKPARAVLDQKQEVMAGFHHLLSQNIDARRTRVHGDYHLGQVLNTGSDFVIIDFEGEPDRSIDERRIKCSPLRDVAGMLRSFHYAAYSALFDRMSNQDGSVEDDRKLDTWAQVWQTYVSAAFLKSYLSVAAQGYFLPAEPGQLEALLDAYLLDKAIYEMAYELNNRPSWARIPLQGIVHTLESRRGARPKTGITPNVGDGEPR
jgi:trehalose synthase-fused probable maltokinase